MATLTPNDVERLTKIDRDAGHALAAKSLVNAQGHIEQAGGILRSATEHDSVWYGWKARFMHHHEHAGQLAEEIEQRRQHWQQQRRDVEARGRHQGAKPMADPTTMRMARAQGCRACVYAKLMRRSDGSVSHAECHVDPPRTSSTTWPSVDTDDFCGRWMAAGEPQPVTPVGEPRVNSESSVEAIVAALEAMTTREPTPEELIAVQEEEYRRRLEGGRKVKDAVEDEPKSVDDNAPEGAGEE